MNWFNTHKNEPVVRPAAQAGRFYALDAQKLTGEVDGFLAMHAEQREEEDVAALIVPHAGYYFSGNVAASAYMTLNPKKSYKRIFLLGPSHHEWLDGASVNTKADYYATPLGNVKVDRETAQQLTEADEVFSYCEAVHTQEHCLEVQLPFLQRRFNAMPPIVPIIIATNDFDKLNRIAEVLKPYFNDENLFVISSDFSHYPSYEDACEVDAQTGKAIETGRVEDFVKVLEENAKSGKKNLATSACGAFPIITLMLMLDKSYEVKHLMYQNSGDIDHRDHSRVVGYHSFAFLRKEKKNEGFTLTDADKQLLKQIAYNSIRDALDGKPLGRITEIGDWRLNNGQWSMVGQSSIVNRQLSIVNCQWSIQNAVLSFRYISVAVFVVASDTSARTIRCMRLWQRWLVPQPSKTHASSQ